MTPIITAEESGIRVIDSDSVVKLNENVEKTSKRNMPKTIIQKKACKQVILMILPFILKIL